MFVYISIRGEEGREDIALVGGGGGVVLKGGAMMKWRSRARGSGGCSSFIHGTIWCHCLWHGCEGWEGLQRERIIY